LANDPQDQEGAKAAERVPLVTRPNEPAVVFTRARNQSAGDPAPPSLNQTIVPKFAKLWFPSSDPLKPGTDPGNAAGLAKTRLTLVLVLLLGAWQAQTQVELATN